jgi:hypothetical protein
MENKSLFEKLKGISTYLEEGPDSLNDKTRIDVHLQILNESLTEIKNQILCENNLQALLFSIVFIENSMNRSCDISNIRSRLNCYDSDMFEIKREMEWLISKKIIQNKMVNRRSYSSGYFIPQALMKCILDNKIFIEEYKNICNQHENIWVEIKSKFDLKEYEEIDEAQFLQEFDSILLKYKDSKFNKAIKKYKLTSDEYVVLSKICIDWLDNEKTFVEEVIKNVFDNYAKQINARTKVLGASSRLLKYRFIEPLESIFASSKYYVLSKNGIREFMDTELMPQTNKSKFTPELGTVIIKSLISEKELFYPNEVLSTIEQIKFSLNDVNYKQIIKRLKEFKLPQNIGILLYGNPGTGKTELVYQLAKASHRNIYKIDVSNIRDKYVGETEKNIKKVFEEYRAYTKFCNITPILLFNEADSIISKRLALNSSVDQMNNNMQNILLEQLENFKGIFIATTNLTNNMDKAFERRFLYKVEIPSPDFDTQVKIWKSKLKFNLSDDDIRMLSLNYQFTGAQIDNIARKSIINYVLNNSYPDFNVLDSWCKEESIKKIQANKIGFFKN